MKKLELIINRRSAMRHQGLKLSIILLLALGLTSLQAQTMFVKKSDDTQTSFTLTNVRKLTFPSGKMLITKTDETTVEYTLNGLRYLSFLDHSTSIPKLANASTKGFSTFPNPVKNTLNVNLSGIANPRGIISILSVNGKLLQTKQVTSSAVSLDVSTLSKGVYFCRYTNGKEFKTLRIIKE